MHKDLTGKKFGRLTVIGRTNNSSWWEIKWICICECWNGIEVQSGNIKSWHTNSCWCFFIECHTKHWMVKTRQYRIWRNLKNRCLYKTHNSYKNYGWRWITVCDRWLESFENFWEDMKKWYQDDLTIDRIDVNWNYCPENCRWITAEEQARNTSRTQLITYNWKTLCLKDWSAMLCIDYSTLRYRIKTWWSIERAFTKK